MNAHLVVKRSLQAVAMVIILPSAVLSGFGRFYPGFQMCSHYWALVPGLPGNFLRAAFYKLTLREASLDVTISFGTFFSHPAASIAPMVSVGSYCVIGKARIGARTQIASHVEIPSGRHEHNRDAGGQLSGSNHGETVIGADCWIGSSAIVMEQVGDGSTIGAGAVVVKPIPPRSVAVGNPARVIRSS